MLPLFDDDLEAYASDEALQDLEARHYADWMLYLLNQCQDSCWMELRAAAELRWQQKVNFARSAWNQRLGLKPVISYV